MSKIRKAIRLELIEKRETCATVRKLVAKFNSDMAIALEKLDKEVNHGELMLAKLEK